MDGKLLRWPDLLVIGISFVVMIFIGGFFARRNKSSETYFLAGRNMPGWLVGFSVMATIISSMSFLATPGFAFAENWRHMVPTAGYLIATIVALFLFMPFFRRSHVNSAYEYLELRFGTWARLYAATCFLVMQIFRIGIILYAVSLPIQAITGWQMHWVIVIFGIVVAVYTVAGGLEAVIWTDLLQGIALIIGAFICIPILVNQLPGGFSQIIDVGMADNKFSLGSMDFTLSQKGFWVMLITAPFGWLQIFCIDQSVVQRYCAPSTLKEARKSIIVGAVLSIPLWTYFFFIGTALYVFYKINADPAVAELEAPEQIFPYFILTRVPAGLAGFVITGLVAAAMSTLDSLVNATAATATTDFYRRLIVKNKDEKHYLSAGRWFSILSALFMISAALIIHFTKTQTLNDLQALAYALTSGGLLGLFMLGLLTKKADSRSALIAAILTFAGLCFWLFVKSPLGAKLIPALSVKWPHDFWLNIFTNVILFASGYLFAKLTGTYSKKDLSNLTVWTTSKNEDAD